MGTTTAKLTLEEFERLPDEPGKLELLGGELIRMPPPDYSHMDIAECLYNLLNEAVGRARSAGASLGKVHIEMGYLLTDTPSWLRPDVSITHPNQPRGRYYEGAPMIVFEIVSSSDSADDLERKVEEYLAHGALEVWVFYPKSRHARVFDSAQHTARREDQAIRSPHLPGIEIPFEQFL